MNHVFADTAYWIALASSKDRWHDKALSLKSALSGIRRITTMEVLSEFLNAFCKQGPALRKMAVDMVREIQNDPDVEVVPQSSRSFHEGLVLYEKRLDKGYSLADCISMRVAKTRKIEHVLTSDKHFRQEGFTILLTDG